MDFAFKYFFLLRYECSNNLFQILLDKIQANTDLLPFLPIKKDKK